MKMKPTQTIPQRMETYQSLLRELGVYEAIFCYDPIPSERETFGPSNSVYSKHLFTSNCLVKRETAPPSLTLEVTGMAFFFFDEYRAGGYRVIENDISEGSVLKGKKEVRRLLDHIESKGPELAKKFCRAEDDVGAAAKKYGLNFKPLPGLRELFDSKFLETREPHGARELEKRE